MADMRRRELAKLPLSTPWWALLHHISPCHTAMISSSLAPERSRERRSASWSANKQLRIWPSAVSRVREQFAQNGRVTEAMIPSHPGRVCRELTDLSLPKIGDEFGGKDHTTVMYADRKIRKEMTENRGTYDEIQELTQVVKNRARTRGR